MPGSNHHICSQVKLAADYNGSESSAQRFLKELPHLVNNALDYISDELDGLPLLKKRSIRFSELAIDIGSIDERHFRDEFKNRLRNALIEKIQQVEINTAENNPGVESVDLSHNTDRLIRHLLCHGTAPWWIGKNHEIKLQNLISELVRNRPDQMIQLLHDTAHLPAAMYRLVHRVDNSTKLTIVKNAEPADAAFIEAFLNLLIHFSIAKGLSKSTALTTIWSTIFTYLIRPKSRLFNRSDFAGLVIKNFSTEFGIDRNDLTKYASTDKIFATDKSLKQVLKEAVSNTHLQPVRKADRQVDDWRKLKTWLIKSDSDFTSTTTRNVRVSWDNLFNENQDRAFRQVKKLAADSSVRRNLSIFLRDEDLKQIVKLAEPANASFILDHSRRTVISGKSIPELKVPKSELRAKSWEFILTYLFEDKGSQFNRKQFLRSTLEQFSAHYNLHYSRLLSYFIVLTSQEQSGSANAVHSLLKSLEEDDIRKSKDARVDRLWEDANTFRKMTEQARLLTFTAVAKYAEELYQFAKHDPDQLKQLLKTKSFSEDGLTYIWSYLSTSQKGIVLMAVSPPKIRGWEQLISQIETISSETSSVQHSIELDDVFNLVFTHGILNDAGMESLLSIYLDKLATFNRSTRKKLLTDLGSSPRSLDDHQLIKYLNLQPEFVQDNGSSDKNVRDLNSQSTPLFHQIDELFYRFDSVSAVDMFKSLDSTDLKRAKTYISGKRGWSILAGKLPPDQWQSWAGVLVDGERFDQSKAVHDLFRQIYQESLPENKRHQKLQELQGELMTILMNSSDQLNSQALIQKLLNSAITQQNIRLSPESIQQIKKSISSSQTPLFNQWLEMHDQLQGEALATDQFSQTDELTGVDQSLYLLEKLKSKDAEPEDELWFPLLMEQLKERNPFLINFITKSIRKPETVKSWSDRLPKALLIELTKVLIPRRHLEKITDLFHIIEPALSQVIYKENTKHLEADVLFTYSARQRYKPVNTSEFVKKALMVVTDQLPESNREKVIKKMSADIVHLVKKDNRRDAKSIEQMLRSLPLETEVEDEKVDDQIRVETETYQSLKNAFNMDETTLEGEAMYTARAGLILAAPFFPKLFEKLGYLTDGLFTDDEACSRAVHILEFIVTGLQNTEEHELVLQKFLIGLPIQMPVDPLDSLTDFEVETCESMLNGLIANWQALGHTTLAGLREGFLIRDGKLQKSNGQWILSVQTHGVDVLLDLIPWSIGMIKLPWMKELLRVEWR